MRFGVKVFLFAALACGLVCVPGAFAQGESQQNPQPNQNDKQTAKQAAKQRSKRDKDLFNELDSQYKKWLNEDVVYIISPEERSAFLHLQTNEEREQFIEAFWQRRNPDPDSAENTFKEEHYRRIAYANEHYSSGIPGWKTDRGRIYIMWGPPDEIQSHHRAAVTIVPRKKAAAKLPPIRSKIGAIATSRASVRTSNSNSLTPP